MLKEIYQLIILLLKVDKAEYIDIIMPMYNLIEYGDNYSKTSGSLWQYCKEILAVKNNENVVDFNGANATDSFNFKLKITGQTAAMIIMVILLEE